ncbi:MAG TPA: ATP-dependent DNA helicase [Candidatus Dormibacteraeota bacterium]|nr:ATP-dependent DNA helicase [Candidatus Dormibacteraeota bacterium]
MSQSDPFWERAQKALTPAQFEVVQELGRGPVKVAAAAGSGKTTTMAWLYAAALVSEFSVGQIMAVTFTERAAAELRQKVLAVMVEAGIAPPAATGDGLEGAWIGTFHQLIRRLVSDHAYRAGLPRDLELIDEVAAGMVMGETLESVRRETAGANSWLRLLPPMPDPRTVLSLVDGAARAVRRLRSTELVPGDCERESLVAYARAAELGDSPEEIAWHRTALSLTTTIWQEYERRLAQLGALDFDGLLREGLLALQRSPRLLGWCRSNFRLVIVDEYQDTSALQESLIKELTGPEHRSLFMVGDARQSIYAFRDAKPGIMADALGRQFELFRNHRSRESILAAADFVIKADPNFAADEPMVAARATESPLPVWLAEVEDPVQEAEAIAAALDQIHREGVTYPDRSHHEVLWREMAVLAYTHGRIGSPLEEALRRRRIPFQTATGGLLDRPEVRDVLGFLRLAADDQDDLACLRVLQSQVGRIPDRALLGLRAGPNPRAHSLKERLRDHLASGAPGWERSWAERSGRILAVVGSLGDAARTAPAAELVARALAESGLLQLQEARVRAGDPRGRRALGSLRELQRVAWVAESPGRWLNLGGFLSRLAVMQEEAKTAEPPAQTEEDLVTLSTIHRAKGLEWRVVVLADCRPYHPRGQDAVLWDRSEQAVICTRVGGNPTAAFRRWGASPAASVDREERRRLVYVAITRARDVLLVTTSRAGQEGEFAELAAAAGRSEWVRAWPLFSQSAGLPWAGSGDALGPPEPSDPGAPIRRISISRLIQRWGEIEQMRQTAAPPAVQPAQLSFTSIEVLQSCPRQFWYQYLARYPTSPPTAGPRTVSEAAELESAGREPARALGVAIHQALEELHAKSPDRAASLPEGLAALELAGAGLDREQRADAELMLRKYLAGPTAALPTVATEFAFTWADWNGPRCPPLVGLIDRIARLPSGGLLILDYKTNLHLSADDLAEYSRQLQLYAAAVAAGVLGAPMPAPATALAMLRQGELITVVSGPEERQAALRWAASSARRVELGDYRSVDDFPGRPCGDCPFVERCPERRPEEVSGLVRQFEES